MFELSKEILNKISEAISSLQTQPIMAGPISTGCSTCMNTCSNGCKGTCKGSCKDGCTRSCKGHSR